MSCSPAILSIEACIFVSPVKRLKLALVVLAWDSQKKIRVVRARLRAKEQEAAIKLSNGIDVDLIVVELAAHLEGVRSDYFGKIVQPLKSIADLL